jgi:hypothetical protein
MYGIKLPLLHPSTWSQDLLDAAFCSQEKSDLILCAMWALWTARNRRKQGETSISIYQACRWASEMATDLIDSNPPSAYTLKMQMKKVRWCPPPEGVIKVNFDAAFKTETYQSASRVVLRNEQGQFVAAKCKQHESMLLLLKLMLIVMRRY